MRPVKIDGKARPLGKPADWDETTDASCGTLWVRDEIIDGVPYMRSAWEVEGDEGAMMMLGANTHLRVAGRGHPVVWMEVGPVPSDTPPGYWLQPFTTPAGEAALRVSAYAAGPPGGPPTMKFWCGVLVTDGLEKAFAEGLEMVRACAAEHGVTL